MTTPTQTWNPEEYARNARFVAELGMPVVDLLAPVAGERILDLGCGDGYLTARLAARGCDVVGVDASAAQVEAARQAGVQARVLAAEGLDFESEFDAVFSNATLHWVREADRAIAAVWRALKPGGRFVAELGGAGCVARIREGLAVALARRASISTGSTPGTFLRPRTTAADLPRPASWWKRSCSSLVPRLCRARCPIG